ncbi:class II fructose-bisphosphate aldolase [Actinoallomurus rhizosphaericola]|uniref:class II fructose-bisphosphate aldolase n=1 Tax=Actinoallomurus rhizosphaericola TaxID=2952536 RepID=UPI0020940188|nr:class II fructose-bisphosphate aldolase [Actinoallomurus rhizosphaericola]MCO6000075.1 class II fructose-bisphosphate aldolase [Actinoallomurus rhizosphaericola]
MSLSRTGDLVAAACQAGEGVGAFNVITVEHAEGIVAGAELAGAPAILQISQNAVRHHQGRVEPLAAACALIAETARVPIALHLDHVDDLDLLHRAADAGFSSVMYDASHLEYADNLTATRSAADWAHEHGLWIEAELGEVGGKDGVHSPTARTDPGEAVAYVAATGVDALAVAVGSSHAMTTKSASLDIGLVAKLRAAVPVPLVLHGSSGVLEEDLRRAVARGLTKINVGTQLNVAFTAAVRRILTDETLTDPRKYLRPARDAVTETIAQIIRTLATR